MKKYFPIIIFLIYQYKTVESQNLLPNGDFEHCTAIPTDYGQSNLAIGWSNVNHNYSGIAASPDYYHVLGHMGTNFGPIEPNSGNAQMGFCTYTASLNNFREYISTQLSIPMIPGQDYKVTFYLSQGIDNSYSISTNGIGIHFSQAPLTQNTHEPIAQIPQIEILPVVTINTAWQRFTFIYTATEASQYITIGNFRNDMNTSKSAGLRGAYYFIDNLSIVPITNDTVHFLGNDTTVCTGKKLVLDATSAGALSYLWHDGTTLPAFTVSNQGIYWVKITTASGTRSDTINVSNASIPAINLGSDTNLCTGHSITISLQNSNTAYQWQDNSTDTSYIISQPGLYWVKATNKCGVSTDSITVNYLLPPLLTIGNDSSLCKGQLMVITIVNAATAYLWQDNSHNGTYTISQPGLYWVKATNQCGTDTDSIIIESCLCNLQIPTAFSPNNDGINERFRPITNCRLASYRFMIFNRLGQVIYETSNSNDTWDGTYAGKVQPTGTYAYMLLYSFSNRSNLKKYGYVNLVR
ncbi:MAG: gliding motility-associated C-terminal domain-containing protein [Bacteroidota bacterium]